MITIRQFWFRKEGGGGFRRRVAVGFGRFLGTGIEGMLVAAVGTETEMLSSSPFLRHELAIGT